MGSEILGQEPFYHILVVEQYCIRFELLPFLFGVLLLLLGLSGHEDPACREFLFADDCIYQHYDRVVY